ncbi:MAG: hypothetical protein NVS3B10_00160 [Polyangiales bacterium]
MATFGFVSVTINDGGVGSVTVPASQVQVVMGCASGGTATAGTQIVATRSLTTLSTSFGQGHLPEAAAYTIQNGGTVLAILLTTATPGTRKAVIFTGTGTSVITATGNPVDDYFVVFKVITGGTVGTAGIIFQVSLDAGRNFGPNIALGTATTYLIPSTGVTLNFAAGTLVAADVAKFQTTAPLWSTAGVSTALTTLANSVYAQSGWGSMHLVGGSASSVSGIPGVPGADCSTIQTSLNNLAVNNLIYTSLFLSARDNGAPAAYGGSGETESTWISALQTDYSAVSANRCSVGAAYWNMPSAFPNVSAWGAPRYRRSCTWAAAARQVGIPPQRMLSRVKDGSLSLIIVDPTNDPLDGFVYHDERANPGLDYLQAGTGGRFMSTTTRVRQQGTFISHPLTMAASGSDFFLMPFRMVMDIACTIVQQVAPLFIDDDLRQNANGTVYENDAKSIENAIQMQLNAQMLSQGMLSPPGATVTVDRTANVRQTKIVPINISILGKVYVLGISIGIGYSNPLVG